MKIALKVSIPLLFAVSLASAQEPPLTVIESNWEHVRLPGKKVDNNTEVTPAKAMTADDKYYARTARENQSRGGAVDPSEYTVDGRRAALDKIVQDSRTTKTGDLNGYYYRANFKNNSGRTIKIVYWEYRFAEIASPANVVTRQFLCSVDLKDGGKKELWAFSTLGPSDVISAESLAKSTEKLFDEKILINRIEFSDGTNLQRKAWKFDDVEKAVERVTSTPWGKEVCRGL